MKCWTIGEYFMVWWIKIWNFQFKEKRECKKKSEEKMKDVCLQPTVKNGEGSIMFWGCFTANGEGDLARIDGIMNAEKHRQILIHHAIPSGECLIGNGFIFHQDNDPKHTALKCEKLFRAESPHLNINESLWDYFDQRKAEK